MKLNGGISDLLQPDLKARLEQDILPNYLRERRWFASKDKVINEIRLANMGVVNFGRDQILFGQIEVGLSGGIERYQLALGLWADGKGSEDLSERLKLKDVKISGETFRLTDAFSLDAMPIGLLKAMQSGEVMDVSHGQIRCIALPGLNEVVIRAEKNIVRLSAEQSNSSLVIDDSIIIKLIRRVTLGINPEVEMVRYLTNSGYANTPPLLGEIQYVGLNNFSFSMFVVQKFVANQGDAWKYTLEFLSIKPADANGYERFISAVGKRLAELHQVLSQQTDQEAFASRPVELSDCAAWAVGASQQLMLAFDVLRKSSQLKKTASDDRDFALSNEQVVLALLPELGSAGIGSLLTRIHGDFHLGQILVVDHDACIIDFEGEPAKSVEARRAKSSPMRDVAGFLRSLQYAYGSSKSSEATFVRSMSEIFLTAYDSVQKNAAHRWVLSDLQETQLINLFSLEKCAYEICYEAANRPGWLAIPLRGFVEIIERLLHLSQGVNNA